MSGPNASRVMLGAPALLLVHPAIVFNSLNAPGVFFLLKLVAVLFFLLRLHCFFLRFLPLLLVRVGFSLLRELLLGSRWKCYGSVVIVAVVVSSSSAFKVCHFTAFCWVCMSWSVCVSYKYRSSWSVWSVRIKLIRIDHTDQVDLYETYESSWSVWVIQIKLIHMSHTDQLEWRTFLPIHLKCRVHQQ